MPQDQTAPSKMFHRDFTLMVTGQRICLFDRAANQSFPVVFLCGIISVSRGGGLLCQFAGRRDRLLAYIRRSVILWIKKQRLLIKNQRL